MALTKRVYVDGETIITAQNLNDIQDEIISHGNTLVPKTRTVNSKALSSNITLSASDVGAVPTSRKVNNKALSSDITLVATDIGYESSNVGATLGSLSGATINAQNALAKNILSTTTTEALKKGDFRYNRADGRLYRIIAPIASGATIVGGSNAQSLSIGTIFEGFFTINAVIEVNSGYGTVSDGRILTSSAIIIQQRQENGGDGAATGAKTYIYTGQCTNGMAYIYVRNPDGTNPANGTKIFVSILISNFN